MDEIQTRLNESSKKCEEAYAGWEGNKKDTDKREVLREAVHELRKVASRLEIEIALSERDENSKKKIGIPQHRSQRKKSNGEDTSNDLPDFIKGSDNNDGGDNKDKKPSRARTPRRRKTGSDE